MSLRVRADPIDRDIELMLSESLSPKAQAATLAEFAKEQIEEARQANRSALRREPRSTIAVDGRQGAALASVRPDGVIVAEFELVEDVLRWIAEQLERYSPRKSGRYQKSNILFADGVEIDPNGPIGVADEYIYVNAQPYSRKIELGSSSQAPDGVYQVVAVLGQRRFGNIARISFSYRTALVGSIVGGRSGNRSENRNPAIIVRVN